MVRRLDFGSKALTYIQGRLVSAGDIWMPTLMKLDRAQESFCFVPENIDVPEGRICFSEDRVVATPEVTKEVERRAAEFIYSSLVDGTSRGFAIHSPYLGRHKRSIAGWHISFIETQQGRDLGRVAPNEFLLMEPANPSVENVEALLASIPDSRLVWVFLEDLGRVRHSSLGGPRADLATALAESSSYIMVSAFDDRAKLFCVSPKGFEDYQVENVPNTAATSVRRLELSRRGVDYIHQALCRSKWSSWIRDFLTFEPTVLWMLAPGELPGLGGGLMAAKLTSLPFGPDVTAAERARLATFQAIVDFVLEDPGHVALFSFSRDVSWSDSIEIAHGSPSFFNGQLRWPTTRLNLLTRDRASLETVELLWQQGMGIPPVCALVCDYPSERRSGESAEWSAADVNENLVPATTHLIVGVYGGDLCLVWSKTALKAAFQE